MAAYITVGAKTTHGGTVISGSPHTTHNGTPISRKGDKVICKKCKKLTTILTGDPSFIIDGAPIARGGDMTSCGAKLIAIQQSFCESNFEVMGVEEAEDIKREAQRYFNEVMADELYDEQFQLIDDFTGKPLKNVPYVMLCDEKELLKGITDGNGFTVRTPKMPKAHDITILLDMEVTL